MLISNFEMVELKGINCLNWIASATVNVTTGFIFKKTTVLKIQKEFAGSWFFVETGRLTPNYDVENLARSFEAKNNMKIFS